MIMRNFPTVCILISVFLTGCPGDRYEDEGLTVFRYNEASNITSLDPAYARDQANIWPCNQIFNGLLQLDEELNVLPCIARSWEKNESGTIYTFHLRQDVYFHDHELFTNGLGRKVHAEDFVFSFNRILDPAVASPGSWVFAKVAANNGKYAFKANDDSTLIIELTEPFPPFERILTMVYCSVVPREIQERPDLDFRKDPVGTGPFRFKYWKENIKLVLVRNSRYFETDNGQPLPFLDAVAVTFLADKQSAFLEFIKGNLDFISGLDPSYKDDLMTRDGKLRAKYTSRINLVSRPFLNTEYMGILVDTSIYLVKNSPLRHREIRQAINHAIDRNKMIRYLRNNIGYPGNHGIIPPGLPAFDSTEFACAYDPIRARSLIRSAGYRTPEEVPEFTLHTTAEYVDLFKYVQHQLGEIGLKMNIEIDPAATLLDLKANAKINFFRASWIADYPDEENYLALFYTGNFAPAGPNYSHFSDPVYDDLYERAQRAFDAETRTRLYREMNRIIMREAPVIVLYYDQVLRFTGKDISGLGSNPLNLLALKKVKKIKLHEKDQPL